jgi:hypothetical protein
MEVAVSSEIFPALPGLTWDQQKVPIFKTFSHRAISGAEKRLSFYQYPLYLYNLSFNLLRDAPAYNELKTLLGFYLSRHGAWDDFLYVDPSDNICTAQTLTSITSNTYQLSRLYGTFKENQFDIQAPGAFNNTGYPIGITGITSGVCTAPDTQGLVAGDFVKFGAGGTTANHIYKVSYVVPNTSFTLNDTSITDATTVSCNKTIPSAPVFNIYDNGVYVSPHKYSVANTTGIVTFGSNPTAPVTADFSFYHRVRFIEYGEGDEGFNNFMYQLFELKKISFITAR